MNDDAINEAPAAPSVPEVASPIEPPPHRPPSTAQIVFGILLVAIGGGWLIAALDIVDLPWRAILAGALILIGGALILTSPREHHGGLFAAGIILTVLLALASTVEGALAAPFEGGIGERDELPTSLATLQSEYRLAIGDLRVDLRNVDFPEGETVVEASVMIGQLTVNVPPGTALSVEGEVTAGELNVGFVQFSGTTIDEVVEDDDYASAPRRLRLIVKVGLGNAEVRR
jgi:hypothetical protein